MQTEQTGNLDFLRHNIMSALDMKEHTENEKFFPFTYYQVLCQGVCYTCISLFTFSLVSTFNQGKKKVSELLSREWIVEDYNYKIIKIRTLNPNIIAEERPASGSNNACDDDINCGLPFVLLCPRLNHTTCSKRPTCHFPE